MARVTAQTTDGYASKTCCGNPVTAVGLAAAPPKGFGEEPKSVKPESNNAGTATPYRGIEQGEQGNCG